MKKIVSLLLCVALLCSMIVVVAQADTGARMDVADVTALPGSEVSFALNVLENPGVASIKIRITDTNGLGVFSEENVDDGKLSIANGTSLTLQSDNLKSGILVWFGAANFAGATLGTLTFTIPADATPGDYTFTVAPGTGADQACNKDYELLDIAATTFVVHVRNEIITGVNVSIDAGLAIGIHVKAVDPDETSITAVNLAESEYAIIEDYEEGEADGEYIYFLNVNPWAMDEDYLVDLTSNFKFFKERPDELDLANLPESAREIGILSYCEALLADAPSEELTQLIADMLEYGRQAQIYQGTADDKVMALPAGLTATETVWENGDGEPVNFGEFCAENFGEDLTGKNSTAKKKFKFVQAEINFGAKFVVTFTVGPNGTNTAIGNARIKVDGETSTFESTSTYTGTFQYAFSPAQYAGTQFDLYAASNTNATNYAWINNYGPAYYAAYVYGEDDTAEILTILEAFYNYGASAEAYAATLGE